MDSGAENPVNPERAPVGVALHPTAAPPVANRLRHGVVGGDPGNAPRCGARTRSGTTCQAPAMRQRRRCRLHGGKATGPTSVEGLERLRAARTVHGGRSAGMAALLKQVRALRRAARQMLNT